MGSLTDTRPADLVVTAEAIRAYAAITDDFNPIHVDPDFAATTPMKGVIAHGTMSLALIWQMLRREFGPARSGKASLEIRFTQPVRIGDHLRACHAPDDQGGFDVWVENQAGVAVIKGSARL
ncbi:MAG: MaoC family dehydratase [Roseovarius sp.]|nr:MaoC family dehydratase [Thalassobaculaceae bacterium]OWU66396.1 hypothetical protein ATO2_18875 [Roseovarius sp. 22II1-1F6A]